MCPIERGGRRKLSLLAAAAGAREAGGDRKAGPDFQFVGLVQKLAKKTGNGSAWWRSSRSSTRPRHAAQTQRHLAQGVRAEAAEDFREDVVGEGLHGHDGGGGFGPSKMHQRRRQLVPASK
jgi:hypothetical protein